jgi:hypothetical protein
MKELRAWAARHEERHGDDADMLQLVLNHLQTHTKNHHGRTSEVKRTVSIGAVLAVLAAIAEVIRQFVL